MPISRPGGVSARCGSQADARRRKARIRLTEFSAVSALADCASRSSGRLRQRGKQAGVRGARWRCTRKFAIGCVACLALAKSRVEPAPCRQKAMSMRCCVRVLSIGLCGWLASGALAIAAQDPSMVYASDANRSVDQAYTDGIRRYTTDPALNSPLIDYLPASTAVPTPEKILGHIAGAPDYTRPTCAVISARLRRRVHTSQYSRSARTRRDAR